MSRMQLQVEKWHRAKFPDATFELIGLKLGEEAGEVQRALIRRHEGREGGEVDEIAMEIGDVGICLLRLCAEFGLEFTDVVETRFLDVGAR